MINPYFTAAKVSVISITVARIKPPSPKGFAGTVPSSLGGGVRLTSVRLSSM